MSAPLIEGPFWYRSRIRRLGPFAGLIVPATLGLIAIVVLKFFDGAWSGAVGLIAGVCAAPGLLVVGAPFGDSSHYPLAIAGSAVMWMLVGLLASRRCTRNPMATWTDYWRQFFGLCAGIWLGCCAALLVAADQPTIPRLASCPRRLLKHRDARSMHRLDLLIRLWLCLVALEVTLDSFLFLLLAEERFHRMTEEFAASFSPLLAFLVCGIKEFWRQANGDLDGFTHATSPVRIILKYEKSMNNEKSFVKGL